jgi:Tfp pilus assembly protein PilN
MHPPSALRRVWRVSLWINISKEVKTTLNIININLATFDYQNKRFAYPMLFGAAIILLATSLYTVQTSYQYQNEIFEYEKKIESLTQKNVTRQKINKDVRPVLTKEEEESIRNDIDFVNERIIKDVFPWDRLLSGLEMEIPEGAFLTGFSTSKDFTKIKLQGKAESMKEVGMFLANLNNSTTFQNSELVNLSINQPNQFQTEAGKMMMQINFEIESNITIDQLLSRGTV